MGAHDEHCISVRPGFESQTGSVSTSFVALLFPDYSVCLGLAQASSCLVKSAQQTSLM
jgi:hypothetical protein